MQNFWRNLSENGSPNPKIWREGASWAPDQSPRNRRRFSWDRICLGSIHSRKMNMKACVDCPRLPPREIPGHPSFEEWVEYSVWDRPFERPKVRAQEIPLNPRRRAQAYCAEWPTGLESTLSHAVGRRSGIREVSHLISSCTSQPLFGFKRNNLEQGDEPRCRF